MRLVVLSALVAAAAAFYNGIYGGYNAPLTYAASPLGYAASPLRYAASPLGYAASPLGYAASPAAYAAAPAPYTYSRRYQSQDEFGRASFGHEEPNQNHAAVRDAFGNVAGSYNYINPEGETITVKYTAGVDGFQVVSNALPEAPVHVAEAPVDTGVAPLPVDFTDDVKQATAEHMAAVEKAKAEAAAAPAEAAMERRKRSLLYSAAPLVAAPAAGYAAQKTEVILNPGHATAYRVDPLI